MSAGCYHPRVGPSERLVLFGTYTGGGSEGIYAARFDGATGRLGAPWLAAATPNPSFLAVDEGRRLVYAVNETDDFEGRASGAVSSFALEPDGRLRFLSRRPSLGATPCHLSLDRSGSRVLVANYHGGSVAVLPVAEGRLEPAGCHIQHVSTPGPGDRQASPRAHCVTLDAAERFAFVADLGLDQVCAYRFDRDGGALVPHALPFVSQPPGSGPRHLAFHPDGSRAFLVSERSCTVTAFDYDPERGSLRETCCVSTLPAESRPGPDDTGAALQVHPGGRFLYVSNRGPDSIAVFSIEGSRLALVECVPAGGRTPRHCAVAPDGRHLIAAHQGSGSVAVFAVDPSSGRLAATGATLALPSPVCVAFI